MNKLLGLINNIKTYLLNNNNLEDYKMTQGDINEIKNIDYKDFPLTKGKYSKTKLYIDDSFEIVLISWDKNVKTDLHSHPKNGCIMVVLEGSLFEKRINDIMELNYKLKNHESNYIDDSLGKHMIISKKKSYSLHIYSPPNFYD